MLEVVADVYDANSPNTGFVVAKNISINGPRDLAGKTIASHALGDLFLDGQRRLDRRERRQLPRQ